MSMHVYVSNPGFKDEPIGYEQWLLAAEKVASEFSNFTIVEKINRKTKRSFHFGKLTNDSRQRLSLDPYGLIHAQNPSEELIEIMFALAEELDASVYSERLKPYKSVSDWRKRTENYRNRRNERMAASKKAQRKKQILWLLYILGILTIGYLVGSNG